MRLVKAKAHSEDSANYSRSRRTLFLGVAMLSTVLCNSDGKFRENTRSLGLGEPAAAKQEEGMPRGYVGFFRERHQEIANERGMQERIRTPEGAREFCDSFLQPQLDFLYRSFGLEPLVLGESRVVKIAKRFEGVRIRVQEEKIWGFSGMTFPFFGNYRVISMPFALDHELSHVAAGIHARAAVEMLFYGMRDNAAEYGSQRWARDNKELALMEATTCLMLRDTCYLDLYNSMKSALDELGQKKRKAMLDCIVLCAFNFADRKQIKIAEQFLVNAIGRHAKPEKRRELFGIPIGKQE